MLPGMELMGCSGLAVPAEVMHHVVRVESSYNPYAIGVVGGRLVRQPRTLPEALATVRMLETKGYNFSLGLAQVNRYNLSKYGLDSYERAFDVCPNLQAGSRILAECYNRAGGNWGKSFSCYYSGNFATGYRHGYVQKIYASMGGAAARAAGEPPPIEVKSNPSRRVVEVTRYPERIPRSPGMQRIAASVPPARVGEAAGALPEMPAPRATMAGAPPLPSDLAIAGAMPQVPSSHDPARTAATKAAQPIAEPAVDEAFVF